MHELVFAALVGLSLGNSWLCLFMAFGMSTAEPRTGMWFLIGRTVGLVVLGLLIVFAGLFLELSPKLMQGIAGTLAVAFGAVLIIQHKLGAGQDREGRGCGKGLHKTGTGCSGNPGGKHKHGSCHNLEEPVSKSRRYFGFGFGLFRGITPCFKIIVLAPLLIVVSVPSAVAMVLVFTVVSMVYPLIGYLSANTLHNLVQNRHVMIIIGAVILILIGIYYIYESVQTTGVHIPGSGGGV